MKSDPKSYRRRSVRLRGYDYSQAGAYYVTIVTDNRMLIFGEITDGQMVLNDCGKIARECWQAIPDHFPHVELGAFVIMPNHVHGIIWINDTNVGARHASPLRKSGGVGPGSLGAIVGSYKAAVTRHLRREMGTDAVIRQRNYYEHIIRDETELETISDYIAANPNRWNDDNENPTGHVQRREDPAYAKMLSSGSIQMTVVEAHKIHKSGERYGIRSIFN